MASLKQEYLICHSAPRIVAESTLHLPPPHSPTPTPGYSKRDDLNETGHEAIAQKAPKSAPWPRRSRT